MHSFEQAPGVFFPSAGLPTHIGAGAAVGYNLNVAFPHVAGGFGDADYTAAFEILVMPIARAFGPSLVVIAAGFDSARGDPIGGFDLTPRGYAAMIEQLSTLADGRVVGTIEGGYNSERQAAALCECIRVLKGNSADRRCTEACPKEETALALAATLRCLAPYWDCLTGWEQVKLAGVHLGNILVPPQLGCEAHTAGGVACWCGFTSALAGHLVE